MVRRWIFELSESEREERRSLALAGVVTMVERGPRAEIRTERSSMGIMWPGASKGRNKMWSSAAEVAMAN